MEFIEWDESLSVQVIRIDMQHKRLIALINELYAAMKSGKADDLMKKALTELVSYTNRHFTTEEEIFEKHGYTETAQHKAEHQKFVDEITRFKADFEDGRVMLSVKVFKFLHDWILNHIKIVDQKYTPFMKENGY